MNYATREPLMASSGQEEDRWRDFAEHCGRHERHEVHRSEGDNRSLSTWPRNDASTVILQK